MMKQGDAVYQAILNVCGEREGKYEPTKDERASVKQILYQGFKEGKIVLGKDYSDKELSDYIPGLVSNWLRKDKRLNGGVKYEPTNPGSRAGSGDAQVKAMRALLATKTDPSERAEIQGYIDARVAILKPSKSKVELVVDDLPEELKRLVK